MKGEPMGVGPPTADPVQVGASAAVERCRRHGVNVSSEDVERFVIMAHDVIGRSSIDPSPRFSELFTENVVVAGAARAVGGDPELEPDALSAFLEYLASFVNCWTKPEEKCQF
jgi:hypothetical protein